MQAMGLRAYSPFNTDTMKNLKTILFMLLVLVMASCGGNSGKKAEAAVDDDAFYATQPVKSGLYNAVDYDIAGGKNPRKGHFDGRVMFALSPAQSGIYVYENGNRTKIDYRIMLNAPFEKRDSVYVATSSDNTPVTISTDSTVYKLSFKKGSEDVTIGFDSKPTSVASAHEMWERISTALNKK